MQDRPLVLLGAAAAQAAEAAVVCVASVLAAIDTANGKSYQQGSGIALAVIGFATVLALAVVAAGLARARRWSRTPALLTQLFTGIVGVYLLQGHRYEWGGPAVALAIAGFVTLLVPPSMHALRREPRTPPSG
jgi:peptidoglycan/LPS O-acetylase OafA/YrhL